MSISMSTSEPAPQTMLTTYILPRPKCDCFSIKLGTQLISPSKTSFCYLVQFQLQKLSKFDVTSSLGLEIMKSSL
jgi:hypothetical protein